MVALFLHFQCGLSNPGRREGEGAWALPGSASARGKIATAGVWGSTSGLPDSQARKGLRRTGTRLGPQRSLFLHVRCPATTCRAESSRACVHLAYPPLPPAPRCDSGAPPGGQYLRRERAGCQGPGQDASEGQHGAAWGSGEGSHPASGVRLSSYGFLTGEAQRRDSGGRGLELDGSGWGGTGRVSSAPGPGGAPGGQCAGLWFRP